ncbi:hypothetical protein AJ85_17295 [Alkalihalobacillus alcalophilus ATCC 27647 = CGMCC 1.3604]|uniref:DUF4352 domain-containing protein n=1 Tax=Alkalihalobacillus alcalophilus ATCC 27647 = CGMCC 1.3604 TaxID=1218173 RepID=A0A094WJE3_ALKAL|nr:DUF4352 domain-containing protein [Alkalihalobacillus alcalophilus]KGA96956.1 hypothetical protein BALCAV_0213105 [Alkalihalobacillus alcalophilus ATCC 27647 = CGMCC 1.3604]MED1561345.1 DUF4352 domain-containing protein [Alkalihalobacillus alcalophilus]THG89510.1 hypothetical protein AJ85_17295 [Alkalihalobacillus alcalophilus ATCC 27647 = CGMCC 1.3604]
MKKLMRAVGITILAGSILAACNSDEGTGVPDEIRASDDQVDDNTEEEETGEAVFDQDFGDQLDLAIGDTARISSNTGEFEITIHSVELIDNEIDGEAPMFDHFIKAEVTITNIGESVLERESTISILEITDNLEASGTPDYSSQFESIEYLDGKIAPGDTVSVEALFDIYAGEEQYIRVNPGLIASDAVQNDVRWTFDLNEARN